MFKRSHEKITRLFGGPTWHSRAARVLFLSAVSCCIAWTTPLKHWASQGGQGCTRLPPLVITLVITPAFRWTCLSLASQLIVAQHGSSRSLLCGNHNAHTTHMDTYAGDDETHVCSDIVFSIFHTECFDYRLQITRTHKAEERSGSPHILITVYITFLRAFCLHRVSFLAGISFV